MIVSTTIRCLSALFLVLAVQQHAHGAPQAPAKKVNVSFSQSIDVKWKKDKALITYQQRRGKKTDTKRYTVGNMEELRDQNAAAYRLYLQSQGMDMSVVDAKPFDLELIPGSSGSTGSSSIERRPYEEQPPRQTNSSFFGGGWRVNGMINNNGNIRRYNESGTFGNRPTSTGQTMNDQTAAQLRQMIQKSEHPQMRQLLQNMLLQGGQR